MTPKSRLQKLEERTRCLPGQDDAEQIALFGKLLRQCSREELVDMLRAIDQ